MYINLDKHIWNRSKCMANLSKLWANFSVYGAYKNAPEALTIWAEYAIYEAIDKIPEIW